RIFSRQVSCRVLTLTPCPPFKAVRGAFFWSFIVNFAEIIASESKLPLEGVRNTLALFDQGATVPFITRYRKEATGSLDENGVRLIEERYAYYKELSERRETVLKSIEEQGKLTPELRAKI